jgi:hypothetical protein
VRFPAASAARSRTCVSLDHVGEFPVQGAVDHLFHVLFAPLLIVDTVRVLPEGAMPASRGNAKFMDAIELTPGVSIEPPRPAKEADALIAAYGCRHNPRIADATSD